MAERVIGQGSFGVVFQVCLQGHLKLLLLDLFCITHNLRITTQLYFWLGRQNVWRQVRQ